MAAITDKQMAQAEAQFTKFESMINSMTPVRAHALDPGLHPSECNARVDSSNEEHRPRNIRVCDRLRHVPCSQQTCSTAYWLLVADLTSCL